VGCAKALLDTVSLFLLPFCYGDIAQQGERCVRIAKVGGSNPPISTSPCSSGGESSGFLNRVSGVRVAPGVPYIEDKLMKTIAIFGGSKLGQRPWRPGAKVWSIAIFGGSELDFRQAELEKDVTQVVAFSLFGGNKIVVPPDIPVTLSGFSILGGREMKRSLAKEPAPPSAKALHINAIAILGGVEIKDKAEE
jgi:hypothetical protein